ncbi:MAG: arsenate reductase (glutaredoxin) [Flavobacteriales bacterium]|nr:arsenate reductase (glutaredoxin) [Flavobacteriales bacterium]
MKYFHNPRCRKSREGLSILEEKGLNPNIIYYLKEPLSKEDIIEVVNLLNISALDLIRKNEPIFKEKFKDKKLSENDYIDAMYNHPILIERPIFINNKRAIIGRPPEKILELI